MPPAIRRALQSRDKGCRFPGCSFTRYVDGHHVKHWVHGGETKLSNLVTLCRFHHRQVHEGKVEVQILDDGAFRFVRPDGQSFDSPNPGAKDWNDLVAAHDAQEIVITPETARTRWTGEALDDGLAVEWLIQQAKREKNVPPGTSVAQ
ncbi:MAG TPA: HNH endonuclease signature motif containing protein [Steroidobacteraceae bacterium]|nr:HNH endonuclease signature motif containing protein [Steroidobacteraceae bacterium]